MAKPKKPRFKVARHLGENVYNHPKALKRGVKPRRKQSEYSKQLLEKQKLKAYYGILEKQMKRYVERAFKAKGNAGDILVSLLECRLDNIVYRLGFGSTLRQARQMVVHGHIQVNGAKVDKPSFQVKPGDRISLKEKSRSIEMFKENFESFGLAVDYLEKDIENFTGRLLRLPMRDEIPINVKDSLVIEFYSRR